MATAPKPAASDAAPKYFVAKGQLVIGPRGKRVVKNVGDEFTPADDAERDTLLASGDIMSGEQFAALANPAVSDALAAANARAEAAERALAEATKQAPAA